MSPTLQEQHVGAAPILPIPHVDGVEHHFVDVRGNRIHYAEAGDGPPLVLHHGWPQHWWCWRHVIAPLAEHYRVICPDVRGMGWSLGGYGDFGWDDLSDDLVALLDVLGLDRVRLVGHDWGAIAGYRTAIRHPERLVRVAALAAIQPWQAPETTWRSWRAPVHVWTIAYEERGAGEPLIFIHGLALNRTLWRGVVPLLEGDFRCVVPDWPMGGHSIPLEPDADLSLPGLARLAVDFMDALEIESATLVGNDGGGAIAQMVAAGHPERVDRLVLNSSELYDRFLPPVFKGFELLGPLPGFVWAVVQLMRLRPLQRLPFAFGWSIKSGLPEREVVDAYLRPARESAGVRRDLRRYLRAVDKRHTLDVAERLRAFDKPVLLAWAGEDRLFPLDYPRRMAEELPNARLELIPDSYTFVPEDQPEALARLIAEFVREPAAAAR